MFTLNTLLLDAAATSGQASTIMMIVLMAVAFYFFLFRPQQKKQRKQKDFLASLKKGDQVVTIGGIYGKIISIDEQNAVLEVDKGYRIKFLRSAISLESTPAKAPAASTEKAEESAPLQKPQINH